MEIIFHRGGDRERREEKRRGEKSPLLCFTEFEGQCRFEIIQISTYFSPMEQ